MSAQHDSFLTLDHPIEIYWDRRRGVVIPKLRRWPWYQVAAVGLAAGILTGALLVTRLHAGIKVLSYFALLVGGVGLTYGRVRTSSPWYGYAAAHALGGFGSVIGFLAGPELLHTPLSVAFILLLLWLLALFTESLVCNVLGGAVFPWIRSPFIVMDQAECPNCRYSLIGNASGVCPECGFAFVEWWRSMGAQVEYQDVNGEQHPTGHQPAS